MMELWTVVIDDETGVAVAAFRGRQRVGLKQGWRAVEVVAGSRADAIRTAKAG